MSQSIADRRLGLSLNLQVDAGLFFDMAPAAAEAFAEAIIRRL